MFHLGYYSSPKSVSVYIFFQNINHLLLWVISSSSNLICNFLSWRKFLRCPFPNLKKEIHWNNTVFLQFNKNLPDLTGISAIWNRKPHHICFWLYLQSTFSSRKSDANYKQENTTITLTIMLTLNSWKGTYFIESPYSKIS